MSEHANIDAALASIRRAMGQAINYDMAPIPSREAIKPSLPPLPMIVPAAVSGSAPPENAYQGRGRERDIEHWIEQTRDTQAEKQALQRALDEAVVQLHKQSKADAEAGSTMSSRLRELERTLKQKDLALVQAESAILKSAQLAKDSLEASAERELDKAEIARLTRKIEDIHVELGEEQVRRKTADDRAMSATKHQSMMAKEVKTATDKVAELEQRIDAEIKAKHAALSKASQAESNLRNAGPSPALLHELQDLRAKEEIMTKERDVVQAKVRSLTIENQGLVNKVKTIRGENDGLRLRVTELLQQRVTEDKLQQDKVVLREKLNVAEAQASRLLKDRAKLQARVAELAENLRERERDTRCTLVAAETRMGEPEQKQVANQWQPRISGFHTTSSVSPVPFSVKNAHPRLHASPFNGSASGTGSAGLGTAGPDSVRSIHSIPSLKATSSSTRVRDRTMHSAAVATAATATGSSNGRQHSYFPSVMNGYYTHTGVNSINNINTANTANTVDAFNIISSNADPYAHLDQAFQETPASRPPAHATLPTLRASTSTIVAAT